MYVNTISNVTKRHMPVEREKQKVPDFNSAVILSDPCFWFWLVRNRLILSTIYQFVNQAEVRSWIVELGGVEFLKQVFNSLIGTWRSHAVDHDVEDAGIGVRYDICFGSTQILDQDTTFIVTGQRLADDANQGGLGPVGN